jgi:hypothetical protein
VAGLKKANGRVFLIAGIGRPKRYFLWETFEIDTVEEDKDGLFIATGVGWQLAPPVELSGKSFSNFRAECANFIGFRSITELPYTSTLNRLAEELRSPGNKGKIEEFLKVFERLNSQSTSKPKQIPLQPTPDTSLRALSVRQPHAEAIMRGTKTIEYRSQSTNVRGRILIYASQGRYAPEDETEMMAEYRIKDVSCEELPRGVIVGSVELHACDGGEWHLRKPERAKKLVRPTARPNPIWFYPFGNPNT